MNPHVTAGVTATNNWYIDLTFMAACEKIHSVEPLLMNDSKAQPVLFDCMRFVENLRSKVTAGIATATDVLSLTTCADNLSKYQRTGDPRFLNESTLCLEGNW